MALKKMKADQKSEKFGITPSLAREVFIMKGFSHKNILRLRSTFQDKSETLFLLVDIMDMDLRNFIHRCSLPSGGLPMPIVKEILFQTVLAVRYAHSLSVLHRDIKPQNILIKGEGDNLEVKVADWGLARPIKPRQLHSYLTHTVVTLWYRSPELLVGNHNYSTEIDVWAIGIVMFQMLTGTPLVQAPTAVSCVYALFELFGTPHDEPYYQSLPLFSDKFPSYPMRDSRTVFRELLANRNDIDDSVVDLLAGMLNMIPENRMTLRNVMWSPFLKSVRCKHLASMKEK